MTQRKMRAARANGTALGITKPTSFGPDCTKPLPEFQAAFVAARYGLDATRAKLTAELCWRRA